MLMNKILALPQLASRARRCDALFHFKVWRWTWLAACFVSFCVSAASPEVSQLIRKFRAASPFVEQQEIAEEIAKVATIGELSSLKPWLHHRDRRVRSNVAYLFARLGDRRGLATLEANLTDESADRLVEWHGLSLLLADGSKEERARVLRSPGALRQQIIVDRYYAAGFLGKLRDPRAVDVLIPLLDQDGVNYQAAWALGEIGDARAIPGLIATLSNPDAMVRESAIAALEKLRAVSALPNLIALYGDKAVPGAGDFVSVGVRAREAVDVIRAAGPHR